MQSAVSLQRIDLTGGPLGIRWRPHSGLQRIASLGIQNRLCRAKSNPLWRSQRDGSG